MSVVYYSKFGKLNSKIEDKILKHLKNEDVVTYISPTASSSIQNREKYVKKFGGISNLKFLGMDSIRKRASNKEVLDGSFRKYIIQNIIKNGNFKEIKATEGMCNDVSVLINLARENLVKAEDFQKSKSLILKEIGEVFEEYEKFLNTSKYTDLSEVSEVDFNMGLVVFDGFYSMKKSDLAFIEKILKNHEVIFNIPYKLNDISYTDKFVNELIKLGLKVEVEDSVSFNEFIKDKSIDIRFVKVDTKKQDNVLFKFLKSDLLNNSVPGIVNLTNQNDIDIISGFEHLELNYMGQNSKKIKLIEEFKTIVEYTLEANRTNLLRRIDLKYFKINSYSSVINKELLKINFFDLDSLIEKTNLEIPSSIDLIEFYSMIEEIKIDIKKQGSFKSFSDYFIEKLEIARIFVEDFYEKTNDISIYIHDMNTIQKLQSVLERLIEYDNHFGEVSLQEYKNLLFDYLENISYVDTDPFKIKLFSLNSSLNYKFDRLYITGFNSDFPNYDKSNFILEKESEFLESVGMEIETDKEVYERELLKVLITIANSNKAIILRNEEDVSIYDNLFDVNFVKEDRVSTTTELFYKTIDNIDEKDFEDYLSMYQVNENLNEILERMFHERLRKVNGNIVTLSDNAIDVLKTKLDNRGFRVKDLDEWVASAYNFLYLNLVGLEEIIKSPKEEWALEMGTDFHKILENYFKNYDYFDEDILKNMINNVLMDRELKEIRKDVYYSLLSEYINEDLKEREGFKPIGFEVPFEIRFNNNVLKGRIDRIDELNDKIIVVDYKLSDAPGFSKQGIEVFQIPIYMSIFVGRCVEGKYGVISKGQVSHVIRNAEIMGKIKGARNQLDTNQFNEKLYEAKSNAENILYFMYNGIFDKWNNVDARIIDLARS